MNALDLFKAGRLREALAEQIRVGLASPDDATQRLFWCELLLYCGCLDAVRKTSIFYPRTVTGWRNFWRIIGVCSTPNRKRQRLFVGEKPMFLLDPPEHVVARCEAIGICPNGEAHRPQTHLDVAESHTPFVHGHIDGRESTASATETIISHRFWKYSSAVIMSGCRSRRFVVFADSTGSTARPAVRARTFA